MKDTAYTYMVKCRDGSLYTGWTKELEKRMRCHNTGKGARYTKSRLPVRLVYYEVFDTRQEAMKRECALKRLKRRDKLKLVEDMPQEIRKDCERIMETLQVRRDCS